MWMWWVPWAAKRRLRRRKHLTHDPRPASS
jgi:hypothetical protein